MRAAELQAINNNSINGKSICSLQEGRRSRFASSRNVFTQKDVEPSKLTSLSRGRNVNTARRPSDKQIRTLGMHVGAMPADQLCFLHKLAAKQFLACGLCSRKVHGREFNLIAGLKAVEQNFRSKQANIREGTNGMDE